MRNLKPFNLEEARNGAKVFTRDGRPVRILADDFKSIVGSTIVAAILERKDSETIYTYPKNGYFIHSPHYHENDLVLETKEGYVIVFQGSTKWLGSVVFDTESEARNSLSILKLPEGVTGTIAKINW